VYAIPRTAVLGALGITAYSAAPVPRICGRGAAVRTVLSAVYVGVLMWIGLVAAPPKLLKVAG